MMVEPQIPEPFIMQIMPYIIFILGIIFSITIVYDIKEWLWKRRLGKILSKIKEI